MKPLQSNCSPKITRTYNASYVRLERPRLVKSVTSLLYCFHIVSPYCKRIPEISTPYCNSLILFIWAEKDVHCNIDFFIHSITKGLFKYKQYH